MNIDVPNDLALTRVKDSLEGTIAYAVERDGVPLGLLVTYLDEVPSVWWAYARYTQEATLAEVADAPFVRPQDALDAVERAITQHPGKTIAA